VQVLYPNGQIYEFGGIKAEIWERIRTGTSAHRWFGHRKGDEGLADLPGLLAPHGKNDNARESECREDQPSHRHVIGRVYPCMAQAVVEVPKALGFPEAPLGYLTCEAFPR
jgi:hypothetical protein